LLLVTAVGFGDFPGAHTLSVHSIGMLARLFAATTRNEDTARDRLQATGRVETEPRIDVEHVARGVAYMAPMPLEANVQFMTAMATKMPHIGRG
jgi:hypothetical protein